MTAVLAIDPGAAGGIAVVQALVPLQVAKMPETEREVWECIRDFARLADFAVIEKVGAMPGQGVSSMFKFGQSYGFLRACLIAVGIPFEEVMPSKWQQGMRAPRRVKGAPQSQHKAALRALAQQLFPSVKVTNATADALLMAEYGHRNRKEAE